MTRQQILEKAITKAIDNGYRAENYTPKIILKPIKNIEIKGINFSFDAWDDRWTLYGNIFDHDFAKALWGEEATYDMTHYVGSDGKYNMNVRPAWQYHLQQLVIADDVFKYLEANI